MQKTGTEIRAGFVIEIVLGRQTETTLKIQHAPNSTPPVLPLPSAFRDYYGSHSSPGLQHFYQFFKKKVISNDAKGYLLNGFQLWHASLFLPFSIASTGNPWLARSF